MNTWILLRGLTREARHWGALPDALREALDGVAGVTPVVGNPRERVLTIDLPGNGEYADLRAPLRVAEMVDFVRAAARERGAPGPYCVLAMSLGGMVATCWAQRHPDEIARLVLINTSMRPFSRFDERLRPQAWPGLLRAARHWNAPSIAEGVIHRLTCNNGKTRAADLNTWTDIRASAPVSRANALRQLLAAARFSAGKRRPACATLVLSSREDGLVDPACSVSLAAAWGADHWMHPWAGHDLPHDDPAWTVGRIRAWLAQTAGCERK
ncbi:putative hydrolase or acyltransferase of alpha/beta superfamily [Paraburkholderia piptadeniae]|uniref:Hydrolase or acyltransferase of alpha/beta superfamily n=1 Tax=Paraburkholderia piptadeniae TaxID=1701573 RepID=A0A1N7SGL6_9BURK|nr:alpha/beta hydrolase [Paraburkholderia piptadeniae]SIT46119.1 putative hydrolase or acyltransferase of alpha/beta superfamily [Paraburkholderia piptadeniae]